MRFMPALAGTLMLVVGIPTMLAGGALWVVGGHRDDGGDFGGRFETVRTVTGHAVVVDDLDELLRRDAPLVRSAAGRLRLTATTPAGPAFLGLAPAARVDRYLATLTYASVERIALVRGPMPVRLTERTSATTAGPVPVPAGAPGTRAVPAPAGSPALPPLGAPVPGSVLPDAAGPGSVAPGSVVPGPVPPAAVVVPGVVPPVPVVPAAVPPAPVVPAAVPPAPVVPAAVPPASVAVGQGAVGPGIAAPGPAGPAAGAVVPGAGVAGLPGPPAPAGGAGMPPGPTAGPGPGGAAPQPAGLGQMPPADGRTAPEDESFWRASGLGAIEWTTSELSGEPMSLVVMRPDARAGLAVDLRVDFRPSRLDPVTWALLAAGVLLLVLATAVSLRPARPREVVFVVEPDQVPLLADRLGVTSLGALGAPARPAGPGRLGDPAPTGERLLRVVGGGRPERSSTGAGVAPAKEPVDRTRSNPVTGRVTAGGDPPAALAPAWPSSVVARSEGVRSEGVRSEGGRSEGGRSALAVGNVAGAVGARARRPTGAVGLTREVPESDPKPVGGRAGSPFGTADAVNAGPAGNLICEREVAAYRRRNGSSAGAKGRREES